MRLLIPMLFLIPLCAQPPQQEGARPGGGRGPQQPKNLKILSADQPILPIMRSYTVALGVRCDYCHVQGDFASDEKRKKEQARMMIAMVRDINAKFPGNRERVTCYTCHRGAAEPASAPPSAEAKQQ